MAVDVINDTTCAACVECGDQRLVFEHGLLVLHQSFN